MEAGRARDPDGRPLGGDGGLDRARRRRRAAVGDGRGSGPRGRRPQPSARDRALRRPRRRAARGRPAAHCPPARTTGSPTRCGPWT